MEGFNLNDYKWLDSTAMCISKDWLQLGKVSPVKDQLLCGSCWAQTTVAAIEVADAIKHRIMFADDVRSFSAQ